MSQASHQDDAANPSESLQKLLLEQKKKKGFARLRKNLAKGVRDTPVALARIVNKARARHLCVRRQGGRFLLDQNVLWENRFCAGRKFEADDIRAAIRDITHRDIRVLIDVGANIGLYSVLLNLSCPGLRTIAFEPQKTIAARLCVNLHLNDLTDRIDVHMRALSDQSGVCSLYTLSGSPDVSRLALPTDRKDKSLFSKGEDVKCAVFDQLFSFWREKVFVKIDTEGHGLEALCGMKNLLRDNEVIIQVEVDEQITQIDAFLQRQNYYPSRMSLGNIVYVRDEGG